LDYALLNLLVTFGALVVTFVFRRRILAAFGRLLSKGLIDFVQATMWDEDEVTGPDGKIVRRRVLSEAATAQLRAIAPVFVQAAMESIKLKLPKFAPINAATGELDMMAPILAKAMDGKKITTNDALPLLLSKFMPLLESLFGGGGKSAEVMASERNPFLPKELG